VSLVFNCALILYKLKINFMTTLLNIQCSPRYETSLSRVLSARFIEQWLFSNPNGKVITRDLMKTELPFIDTDWLSGAYIAQEKHTQEMKDALKISDELVSELKTADQILIGTPMHNFNVPANFKAYIDQIVRFNQTYNLNDGMLEDKKTTIILASGRLYTIDAPEQYANHVNGFLKSVLNYIGIKSIQFVLAGGMRAVNLGQETLENHTKKFETSILEAIKNH
jgi:FMN-dependent NADH-azoreductase